MWKKLKRLYKFIMKQKKMLSDEERFTSFFKPYHPKSIEGFIEDYAQQKSHWYGHAEGYAKLRASKNNHWWYVAVGAFKEIAWKKLFDVKCRWVAGEMDLPGIETSGDFNIMMQDVSLCSAVTEPVTGEELNCYLAYLKSGLAPGKNDLECGDSLAAIELYHRAKSGSIQEFDEEREASYISPWYRFYDKEFGTGRLLKLPLTRMDLELDYHDIWSENIYSKTLSPEALRTRSHLNRAQRMEMRNNPEKYKAYCEEQERKYLEIENKRPKYDHMSTYDHDKMKALVALIEPPEVQKMFHACKRWEAKRGFNDSVDSILIHMNEVNAPIAIRANDDYRKAIREAWEEYSDKVMMDTLPLVYDAYRASVKEHTPFSWKTSAYNESGRAGGGREMKDRLLAARKWKGEPENFDFLKKENVPKPL
jgi:hypothetical protein